MNGDTLERAIGRLQVVSAKAVEAAEYRRLNERNRIPGYVVAMLAKEHAIRGAISESCEEWVKSDRIPLMSADDALFFFDRFFYAFGFGRQLSNSGFSWTRGESDLLRWLLIDSWERITCLTWKHSLENPT